MSNKIIDPAYPGTALKVGSASTDVSLMQTYLNALNQQMPALGMLKVDGKFGKGTEKTVRTYQVIQNLEADGVIGTATWNSLVQTYQQFYPIGPNTYPGTAMRSGSKGVSVEKMQECLNELSKRYSAIPVLETDGKFGRGTEQAVKLFQMQFWMKTDGIIGKQTWDAILCITHHLQEGCPEPVTTKFSGTMRKGDSGDEVRLLQSYLNGVAKQHSELTEVKIDGKYGIKTVHAVMAFQAQYGLEIDGITGRSTWERLLTEFNAG